MRAYLAVIMVFLTGCAGQQTQSVEKTSVTPRYGETVFFPKGAKSLSDDEYDRQVSLAQASPIGSADNPVRTGLILPGLTEETYLDWLRCSDGTKPTYELANNDAGTSPYNAIMMTYSVRCRSGKPLETLVHIDQFHTNLDQPALPGFSIVR